ncbi:MAG: IS5 family transposase [Flammeovirgaceae bacterium]
MPKASKNRASKLAYISTSQPVLEGFVTPFAKHLHATNRWVVLSKKIPWDELVNIYRKQLGNGKTGASCINPRVVLGALIIKHICDLSDRETVEQIQENMYMQYFIGYSSFSDESPFDPSLFVEIRNRLGIDQINAMNERIIQLSLTTSQPSTGEKEPPAPTEETTSVSVATAEENKQQAQPPVGHKGKLIVDATACPQDISYPTDLNLLNDAREKSEELIDFLHQGLSRVKKPRTYRENARTQYLKIAQKKIKSKKDLRKGIKKHLNFLKRNLKGINHLLDQYETIPFNAHQHKYCFVIQTLYAQQAHMYETQTHSIEHRIVSIHQPHVRPIVRGKTTAHVEFGAKVQVSLMDGYAFLEELSWDAFNEGTRLMAVIEQYKNRFGYYPKEVAADKIYCNRENRKRLRELGIELRAKPLGRPSAVKTEHVSPGERNPIEGKFGQAKTAYGLNRIKARLQNTSQSWIATIILVLNLVRLTRSALYSLLQSIWIDAATGLKKISPPAA